MRRFLPVLLLASLAVRGLASPVSPWESLHHRSVSRSRQFIVYSDDPNARGAIAMDAEDVKEKFLHLLDTNDNWKRPIVIQVAPPDPADPSAPPSDVRIVDTEEGFKVNLSVVLGPNPREAHFPQQLVRAILLEYAYRNQPALVSAGATYSEPPPWLIEGIASLTADSDSGDDTDLFRSLIVSGKTPTLATFLSEDPNILDGPSRSLYSACSMSLVRLLTGLPNGRALMQSFIRHWPGPNDDPEVELLKAFPALDSGGQSLEKWWTVGLASLSAADRYQGFSLSETCQQLDNLLTFQVVMDKTGKTESFTLDQYARYRKAPGAIPALNNLSIRLLGLEAQSSPLMRDVVAAYEGIAVQLAHRQAHDLQAHLAALADYRKRLVDHMDQIADYLNWYEATQRTQASGSFDEYIRTANAIEEEAPSGRDDPISKYVDSVEQQIDQ